VAEKRLDELDALAEAPDFWNDGSAARRLMRERNRLDKSMNDVRALETDLADTAELAELAEADNDAELAAEVDAAFADMAKRSRAAELEALLSGEVDGNDTFIEIHAGAGGTESQDWANMLLRMYTRWGNSRGFKVELIEQQNGEEAGIKSATIQIKGENAFGWAKTESGVHRLVRISPFSAKQLRHTSFASLEVLPVIDRAQEKDIEISPDDIKRVIKNHKGIKKELDDTIVIKGVLDNKRELVVICIKIIGKTTFIIKTAYYAN